MKLNELLHKKVISVDGKELGLISDMAVSYTHLQAIMMKIRLIIMRRVSFASIWQVCDLIIVIGRLSALL